MSEIIICEQNSKMPKNLIESLNFNQAGMGRHKCVLCAYQNGVKDGEVKALDFAKDDEIEECQHGRKALKSSIEKNLPLYFLFQSDRANKDSDKDVQNPLNIAIQKALLKPEIKSKLDEVEQLMKNEISDIGDATVSKLNEMDPNIATSLKPDYSKTPEWKSVFKFSFTGDDIPINKRGSGVRRLILLNYFRAEADRIISENSHSDVIYAIEEPETSQHPDHQKVLINSFINLSET
jgi:predicted ATP-dependent endonuclease of OLD family